MNLYLLRNFNNYFNRKVKLRDTLIEYLQEVGGEDGFYLLQNANFNPNDGLTTTHVFGNAKNPYNKDWQPDYCLVTDDNGIIISRWYVIEAVRLMAHQYAISLKRDSPSDKYNPLIKAKCYIQKGTVSEFSPLIVNKEGMSLNQIKTKEYFLKDKTKIPWIVCYIPQKREGAFDVDVDINIHAGDIPDFDDTMRDLFVNPDGTLKLEVDKTELDDENKNVTSIIKCNDERPFYLWFRTNINNTSSIREDSPHNEMQSSLSTLIFGEQQCKFIVQLFNDNLYDNYDSLTRNFIKNIFKFDYCFSDNPAPQIIKGKVWKYNNRYYRADFTNDVSESSGVGDGKEFSSLMDRAIRMSGASGFNNLLATNNNTLKFIVNKRTYHYTLTEVSFDKAHYSIPVNTKHCNEVPYDIIAFPFAGVNVKGADFDTIRDVALSAGRSLALANGRAYDVQILPFCPVPAMIDDNGDIDITKGRENVDFVYVNSAVDTSKKLTIGLMATSVFLPLQISKLAEYIDRDDPEVDVENVLKIRNRKEQNETDMWRLCSPNYSGMFEFNISKLVPLGKESVKFFDVNVTFRPFNPYIRVAPKFDFLYGQNYEDARGLICSGDFSITLTDDKFQTYQLQNKNYQVMFDREIENLETNRAIAREQEAWNVTKAGIGLGLSYAGALTSGLAGTFGVIGEGAGALGAIGGLSGMAKSAIGLASAKKQQGWNERQYQETRDFKLDMFNMQLDNIRALPASITKSSAVTYNYKFFPVLEFYTCTAEEKEQFRDKIKYNGMTIGKIGTIQEYLSNEEERYVQGEIIRLENMNDDTHICQDLYEEFKKGLFFEPYIPSNKEDKLKWLQK